MRVWQPGGHLTMERGASVDDWSWRRTARRVALLARLTQPYKLRTALAVASLLAATGAALAPPFLAKLAFDDGVVDRDLGRVAFYVVLFVVSGIAAFALGAAQTYFTGWTRERILAD